MIRKGNIGKGFCRSVSYWMANKMIKNMHKFEFTIQRIKGLNAMLFLVFQPLIILSKLYKTLHLSTLPGLKSLQKSTRIYKSLQESTLIYISLQNSSRICMNLHESAFLFNLWSKKSARIFKNLQESARICICLQKSSKICICLQFSSILFKNLQIHFHVRNHWKNMSVI
jgi:hypothetical protein